MLKTSILKKNESSESSYGIGPQPDTSCYFMEQVINNARATFGSNL